MGNRARENPMKEWVWSLTVGIHQLDILWIFLHQIRKAFIILPASVLFCLTLSGCEAQEGPSVGSDELQGNHSQVALIGESGRSSLQEAESYASNLPRIVAFGDSLTAGLGVAPDDAYPGQLARLLREQGFAYEVINAGVSGDTTAGGLRRVNWILKSQPKLVILELGANDGLRGQSLKDTYDNLNAIIEGLRAKGVII